MFENVCEELCRCGRAVPAPDFRLEQFALACSVRPACGFAGLRRPASAMLGIACFGLLARLVLGDGRPATFEREML